MGGGGAGEADSPLVRAVSIPKLFFFLLFPEGRNPLPPSADAGGDEVLTFQWLLTGGISCSAGAELGPINARECVDGVP